MGAIGRIGAAGGVNRDTQSAGHEAVDASATRQQDQLTGEVKKPLRNQKVDEVSKLYEKQFLGEMVKAMRSTVSFSDTSKPSMAENIYRDQLDTQYVDSWGENGGIGLSDMIYTQLMDRYFNNDDKSFRKQGPIRLSDRDVVSVSRMKTSPEAGAAVSQQIPLRVELKTQSESGTSAKVQAPWAGEVVSVAKLGEGGGESGGERAAVTLNHGQGVRSTLIFKGVPGADIQPGRAVAKEAAIGVLSPEINSFFWNLNRSTSQLDSGPGPGVNLKE